jgi:hypothetical protein
MSGLGAHISLCAYRCRHFFNEMSGVRYLRLFALGNIEPGAGKRRLDLRKGHGLCFHDAVPSCSA